MKVTLIFSVLLYSLVSAQTARDSLLRAELLLRVKADQEARRLHFVEKFQQGLKLDSADIQALADVDSSNTAWMKKVILRLGWPGIGLAGQDGQESAFLLVQHADRDTTFQAKCLQLIRRAFEAGETTGQDLALLTDRVEVAAGRPQIYGTQVLIEENRIIFRPIWDSVGVDKRRSNLGLMPLKEYKALLDSMYTKRGKTK